MRSKATELGPALHVVIAFIITTIHAFDASSSSRHRNVLHRHKRSFLMPASRNLLNPSHILNEFLSLHLELFICSSKLLLQKFGIGVAKRRIVFEVRLPVRSVIFTRHNITGILSGLEGKLSKAWPNCCI